MSADKLRDALEPFAKFACDPLDWCVENGADQCHNCAAVHALSASEASDAGPDDHDAEMFRRGWVAGNASDAGAVGETVGTLEIWRDGSELIWGLSKADDNDGCEILDFPPGQYDLVQRTTGEDAPEVES